MTATHAFCLGLLAVWGWELGRATWRWWQRPADYAALEAAIAAEAKDLASKHADEIGLGRTIIDLTRRRHLNRKCIGDGFTVTTSLQFKVDGSWYKATITEAEGKADK